ncbi:YihY/virulence factor BrkB family protein [Variovorax sp. RA8]|uniref:YihY/virulence factor BrkB family protein n=1 Tax=Variovorax sp. (strain JCM 16519 / RA8) TaxID=662548 RepID=UPI0013178686|nr:YihY/virulence factor BrkB family protein [Variovorax sp. RA8]VTU38274.1 ribonuclease BN/unknown domain fusion protein [Variovorax sp. RA8]
MNLKHLYALCRQSVSAWVDDYAPSMGAAISYYTIFSLTPLLVIVIAIAGALFGREAAQGRIVEQISGLVGREGATAVEAMLRSVSEPDKGLIAGLISAVVLLVGATTVFAELQSALDRIWHVPEREKPSGLWAVLRARLLSFGLILGLAFLLMVSLVVSAGLSAFGNWFGGLLPGWEVLLHALNMLISLGIVTLLFAMIYKLMPTARIAWRDVWIGALVTAVLFELGKLGIGLYLGKSGVNESFAAAGSLVLLVAWVYYAVQIFLLGAEFTKVYANSQGSTSGTKAVQATKVAAAEAEAGTDRVDGAELRPALAQAAPDYSAIGRTARTQEEIDRRVDRASATLLRQVLLLGALTLGNVLAEHWARRQRKAGRRRAVIPPRRSR